jgi:hypothetical protein
VRLCRSSLQPVGFRYPDFKDPPYEPSKLFRVQRIKPLKGVPYYEKKILSDFKLIGKVSAINVHIKGFNNCSLFVEQRRRDN